MGFFVNSHEDTASRWLKEHKWLFETKKVTRVKKNDLIYGRPNKYIGNILKKLDN